MEATTQSWTVKLFFRDEIRRFKLHGQSFAELSQLVADSYGLEEPVLKYIDDEGDSITIASDVDLEEAFDVARSRNQVLKIILSSAGYGAASTTSEASDSQSLLLSELKTTASISGADGFESNGGGPHSEENPASGSEEVVYSSSFSLEPRNGYHSTRSGYERSGSEPSDSTLTDRRREYKVGYSTNGLDGLSESNTFAAELVADLPMGSNEFAPATALTKAWLLVNSGDQAWPSATSLKRFHSATSPLVVDQPFLVGAVPAGQTAEALVSLITPDDVGTYTNLFRLYDTDSGVWFGPDLWLEIEVIEKQQSPRSRSPRMPAGALALSRGPLESLQSDVSGDDSDELEWHLRQKTRRDAGELNAWDELKSVTPSSAVITRNTAIQGIRLYPLPSGQPESDWKLRTVVMSPSLWGVREDGTYDGNINGAVIMMVRRNGCIMCRHQALALKELRPMLQECKMKLIGVVHRAEGAHGFGKYLGGEMYYDHAQGFFRAMGDRRLGFYGLLYPSVWRNLRRAAKRGVEEGEAGGDGRILGGILVVGGRGMGIMYEHREEVFGQMANLEAFVEAVKAVALISSRNVSTPIGSREDPLQSGSAPEILSNSPRAEVKEASITSLRKEDEEDDEEEEEDDQPGKEEEEEEEDEEGGEGGRVVESNGRAGKDRQENGSPQTGGLEADYGYEEDDEDEEMEEEGEDEKEEEEEEEEEAGWSVASRGRRAPLSSKNMLRPRGGAAAAATQSSRGTTTSSTITPGPRDGADLDLTAQAQGQSRGSRAAAGGEGAGGVGPAHTRQQKQQAQAAAQTSQLQHSSSSQQQQERLRKNRGGKPQGDVEGRKTHSQKDVEARTAVEGRLGAKWGGVAAGPGCKTTGQHLHNRDRDAHAAPLPKKKGQKGQASHAT